MTEKHVDALRRRWTLVAFAAVAVIFAFGYCWKGIDVGSYPRKGLASSAGTLVKVAPEDVPPALTENLQNLLAGKERIREALLAGRRSEAQSFSALLGEGRGRFSQNDTLVAFLGAGLASLGARDFDVLLEFLLSEEVPEIRGEVVEKLVVEWEQEVFESAQGEPEPLLGGFRLLSASDPELAANLLNRLPDSDLRSVLAFELVENWFEADSEAALAWHRGLQQGSEIRVWAADAIAEGWAGADPRGALDWAQAIASREERETATATALSVWTEKYPDEALGWMASASSALGSVYADYAVEVAASLAVQNPARAFEWIDTLSELGPEPRGDALLAAAVEGVVVAPIETMAALRRRAADGGELESEAIFHAAAAWGTEAPSDLANYIESMPPSRAQDHAIMGLVVSCSFEDPEASLHWALHVTDVDMEVESVQIVVEEWIEREGASIAGRQLRRFADEIAGEGRTDDASLVRRAAAEIAAAD